jgi:hypothetical protein
MADFLLTFRDLLHAVNLRHGTNGLTSLPKEVVPRIFSPWKIRRLRPGLNPRTWVLKANTEPLDQRSRFGRGYLWFYLGVGFGGWGAKWTRVCWSHSWQPDTKMRYVLLHEKIIVSVFFVDKIVFELVTVDIRIVKELQHWIILQEDGPLPPCR